MQQFFVREPLATDSIISFPEETEHQLLRVLRVRGGETVRLVDPNGIPFLATLEVTKKHVTAHCYEALEEKRELPHPLLLALARIKREKWEWALQKATELGVNAILPMETERVNEVAPTGNRRVRWERILQEAAEQCERHRIPTLEASLSLAEILAMPDVEKIVLAERSEEKAPTLERVLENVAPKGSILLLVGPEGGFSPQEFVAMEAAGVHFANLGPRILRAETAAMLAVGITAQWMEA